MMAGPVDAQAMIHGLHYKVGVRGLVFAWAGDEWIRSTAVTAEQVRRCVEGPVSRKPDTPRRKIKREYPPGDYKAMAVGESMTFPLDERPRVASRVLSHSKNQGKKFSTRKISEAQFILERTA